LEQTWLAISMEDVIAPQELRRFNHWHLFLWLATIFILSSIPTKCNRLI